MALNMLHPLADRSWNTREHNHASWLQHPDIYSKHPNVLGLKCCEAQACHESLGLRYIWLERDVRFLIGT